MVYLDDKVTCMQMSSGHVISNQGKIEWSLNEVNIVSKISLFWMNFLDSLRQISFIFKL